MRVKISVFKFLIVSALSVMAFGSAYAQSPGDNPSAELQGADLPEYPQLKNAPSAQAQNDIQQLIPEQSPVQPVAPNAQVPAPEASQLNAPQSILPRPDPVPGEAAPAIPDTAKKEEFDENLFFDAEQLVPEGEIARKGAPSKVDPSLNPGSALVISTKTHTSGSKEAQLVAADRAAALGRYESSLELYNNLYAKNKRDPNILFGRAAALQSLGRDEEAIAAYEELLNIRPKNLEAQINMQGLIGKRYPAVALRALNDLYASNPGSTALVSQIAIMEGQMGHYEEAIRYLGMAASMEPQNAGHAFNMAVIADRAGDKKAAIKYYEEALETDTLYGSNRSIPRESVYERLAELR